MPRVIFVNRYYRPDKSATSQILSGLATWLARQGEDVHVVTSSQLYDAPDVRLPLSETLDGVVVHRLGTTRFGRSSLPGRAIDYASFFVLASRAVAGLAGRGDVVVAKTDPPLLSVAIAPAARSKGASFVNWLQDVYPEIAVELGVPFVRGPVASILAKVRDASLTAAAANVVLGERMAERLIERGIAADRLHIIPNWAADDAVHPVDAGSNPLRREWDLEGRFVVGYSGNLGRAHECETLLSAAALLRDEPFLFLFVGGGHHVERLRQRAETLGLSDKFRFQPYQDISRLSLSLGAADVHWVSLLPSLEGLIVPSKFYGIAAAGRPVVAVMDPDGELGRIVRDHGIGSVVPVGDAAGLAAELRRLAANPAERSAMGLRARRLLDARFRMETAAGRWLDLIRSLSGASDSDAAAGDTPSTAHMRAAE